MSMLAKETRLEVRDRAGSYAPTGAGSEAVPAGYKRTELGLFPEDWQICELADWKPFVTSGSRGWADYYADHGSAFIRITNMSRESIYLDLDDLKIVNLPPDSTEGVRTRLQDGDLLVSITADIGIIAFIDSSVPKPAYINQHIALVRLDPEKVDSRFLSYFLASERSQKAFRAGTDQGAKAGMKLRGVREITAAFPLLAEQRAIAAALSDVDALLAKLDQLIAKKRDLKQAAMQQLLNGQTRLAGFVSEWKLKRFGDVLTVRHGKSRHAVSCDDGQYPILASGGEIGRTNHYLYDKPSVLIGRKGTIDKPRYVESPFWTVDTLFYTEVAASASAKFLFYKFGTIDWRSYNEASGVPSLNASTIESIEFSCPDFEEQAAIATILSDMDAELAALEARRAKTQDLKQGMMQALLTGRIRLL